MGNWEEEQTATISIIEILIRTELALIEYANVVGDAEVNSVIGVMEDITNRDLPELDAMFSDVFESYEFSRSDVLNYIFEQPQRSKPPIDFRETKE